MSARLYMAQPGRSLTFAEWGAEARTRFGEDEATWRFVCPSCGHVATVQDWRDAGAPETSIGFSCVGRWLPGTVGQFPLSTGPGPCNYAGGGLFALNPVRVQWDDGHVQTYFEFAEGPAALPAAALRMKGDTLDFADLGEAERWLAAHGYVCGPMQRDAPIGVQPAACYSAVAKWRNLTKPERAVCVAVLRVGGDPQHEVTRRPWRLTWQHSITEVEIRGVAHVTADPSEVSP